MISTQKQFKSILSFIILIAIFCSNILATTQTTPIQAKNPPEINSKSYVLLDYATGQILAEKNKDLKIFPASTTKILTAIVVIENSNLTDTAIYTKEMKKEVPYGSSIANLQVDEEMSISDLLYCLMLPSGNDAAITLAHKVGGDLDTFVKMLNLKAVQLGAYNTNFTNPHGFHDENHYTTANDMAVITRYALNNEFLKEVVNTAQKTLQPTNKSQNGRKVFTTNKLILRKTDPEYYKYADGIKTGTTTEAGYCLVSNAVKNDRNLISAIYGASQVNNTNPIFSDSKNLFEWGFENYNNTKLLDVKEPIYEIQVHLSSKADYVSLRPENSLSGLVPSDFDPQKITFEYTTPEYVNAPVKEGQQLGYVKVSYNGSSYGKVALVSVNDVELSQVLFYVDKIENFFDSTLFKIILALLILILLFTTLSRRSRRKRRKRRIEQTKNIRYRDYKGEKYDE